MKKIVVNFAKDGREHYIRGAVRLGKSLKETNPDVLFMSYIDEYPNGCPTHEQVPYAFKYHCMQKEWGYADLLLWLDASVVVKRSMTPIWDHIQRHGVFIVENQGMYESVYTSVDCLRMLGCSWERARDMVQCCGGVVGFDTHDPRAKAVFNRMLALSKDGVSFQGKSGSTAPEFVAHRHDQSCLTVVAHDAQLPFVPMDTWLTYQGRKAEASAIMSLEGIA